MSIEDAVNEFCEKELGVTFDNVIGCDGEDIFSAFIGGYDHAKDELAALREELAQVRDDMAAQRNHFRAQLADAKDADQLQQRLTAAEQRNAELVELLREALPHLDTAASAFKVVKPVRDKVRAALKPTESGASE